MATTPELPPTPRRRWLQFSLRTVLLLTVVAAIVFSLWTSDQRLAENRRLQTEIKRLRSELGELTIEDGQEDKLHAIGIPTIDAMIWKWRVYVPKGKMFYLKSHSGVIPPGGKLGGPSISSQSGLSDGEHIITAALRRNHNDEWNWIIKHSTGESRSGVPRELRAMMEEGNYGTTSSNLGREQRVLEPGGKLELLRLEMEPNQSSSQPKANGAGLTVWITDRP